MAIFEEEDELNDQASRPDPFQDRDDGFYNPKREPHLPEDLGTPASDPDDVLGLRTLTDPETDTNIEASEAYDEGIRGATDEDAHSEDPDTDEQRIG